MSAQTVAKDRMPDSGVGLDGRRRLLIVDDDRDFAEALEDLLVSHGYDVVTAHSPATALETEADFAPDVALIDVRLGQSSGMDLVEAIKDRRPDIVCIMVTAYANVETAVDAMRHGADDYLRKPVETAELFATLERGFATRQLLQDKRVAEDKLSASEERFRGMVENSPAAIFLKDLEGRYRLVNRRFEEWYGVSAADAVGRTSYDVYPKAYADSYTALDREVLETGQSREQELDAPFADGSVHRIIVNKFPVFGTDGQVIGLGSVNTDVTEQRAAEAQLRQAQKMEAVGRLTGGVAHDFNNLLAVILGNLEILDEELQGDGNLHDLISAAVRAATRGGELTHRLLAFSRRQPLSPVVTDLNRHVMEMSDLLRRTLGPGGAGGGPDQPGLQRPGRHARRRNLDHRNRRCRSRRDLRRGARGGDGGALPDAEHIGQRSRHGARGAGPGDRSLFHDQGGRRGQRSRPQHGLWIRQTVRRACRNRERAGPGHHRQALFSRMR
jgi:PAS domain S-box-containing protein